MKRRKAVEGSTQVKMSGREYAAFHILDAKQWMKEDGCPGEQCIWDAVAVSYKVPVETLAKFGMK